MTYAKEHVFARRRLMGCLVLGAVSGAGRKTGIGDFKAGAGLVAFLLAIVGSSLSVAIPLKLRALPGNSRRPDGTLVALVIALNVCVLAVLVFGLLLIL